MTKYARLLTLMTCFYLRTSAILISLEGSPDFGVSEIYLNPRFTAVENEKYLVWLKSYILGFHKNKNSDLTSIFHAMIIL